MRAKCKSNNIRERVAKKKKKKKRNKIGATQANLCPILYPIMSDIIFNYVRYHIQLYPINTENGLVDRNVFLLPLYPMIDKKTIH